MQNRVQTTETKYAALTEIVIGKAILSSLTYRKSLNRGIENRDNLLKLNKLVEKTP